jgi:hypothetical protein
LRHCGGSCLKMCHQLVSSVIHAESFDLRSLLFLTMRSGAFWGYQTPLLNCVAIKVVFGRIMKYEMGCERIKIEFAPPRQQERYLWAPRCGWIKKVHCRAKVIKEIIIK